MKNLPTGTVTFLFTDIEGSTELLQRLGDLRYAEVLAEHQRLLRDAFAKGNGQEIDIQGDAFLVAFSRARDAVGAAVSAQRALSKHSWPDGASLQVRMGLHTGEAAGYVGLDVHRAARICQAGHGGQILLSQAVRVLAARDLPPEVSLRDLGAHRLEDLREPEHLSQLLHPDLPIDFPPLKSLDVLPNNLPVQLTSFIGREREKAEVRRLLSATRLLTLTGAGGAGKTRLALQVAAEVLAEFRDGVWLAELATLSDPSLVPKAVASALDVSEQPRRVLTETLEDALRGKSSLVILDNCEHLVLACAKLANALLRTCPDLRILATSREALRVTGETAWQVPSLSLPDPEHLPPLDRFGEYGAVRLFIDRAVASAPQFAVTSTNAPAIAQVCQRLDGIPLAIELAAARVKALTVEQIAARLDDRFRLLTGGSRTALPRHQTLRGAIDWSYELLSENERTLLRRLSVFAGGWLLGAAEGICSGGSLNAIDILKLLAQLVDKSLVVAETQGDEARYRLLETVRQYSRDRLVETGEAPEFLMRHRDWYLALAEQADRELPGPRQQPWLQRLETEHDNLRAALIWSKADKESAEAELRLAGALQWFWADHGHWTEGRAWLEGTLARSSGVVPSAISKALQAATFFALQQGDRERAVTLGQMGLTLSQELGDKENRAMLLTWLGNVAILQGEYSRATELLEESLKVCDELRKPWLTSMALAHLGRVARYAGDYERAAALHVRSLALSREAEDKSLIALSVYNLGMDALRRGDYERAAEYFRESLSVCKEVGNKRITHECFRGLAGVAGTQRRFERAARLFGAAELLRETIGFHPSPGDQVDHDVRVAHVRAAFGDCAFTAAWVEGQAMTLEQAIEYALAEQAS